MYKACSIVPARVEDAIQIAPSLRSADKAELEAATGFDTTVYSLIHGVSFGKAWAVKWDLGELELPIVLFGVMSYSKTVGIPWMVATDDLLKHKRFIIKHSREYVDKMLELYPDGLLNFIDCRNTVHIEYIKHLGFTIDGLTHNYGAGKLPFFRFSKNLKG